MTEKYSSSTSFTSIKQQVFPEKQIMWIQSKILEQIDFYCFLGFMPNKALSLTESVLQFTSNLNLTRDLLQRAIFIKRMPV